MDNLTHTLTGLMLSRAGLRSFCPRASLLLMLAANAPDIDTLAALGGTPNYLDWHRGPTHSLLLLPLMAALVTAVVGLVRRPAGFSWLRGWLLSCIGILSHILLDWTNIYGIRLLEPLSNEWFRLDAVPVIDPFIWAVLLLAVAWPVLARLITAEIGARRTRHGGGLARFALFFLLAYDFGRWTLHNRAIEMLDAHLYDNRVPRRVLAMPEFVNPFAWRGLVDLGDAWQVHNVPVLKAFDPGAGRTFYNAEPSAAVAAARGTPAFQALLRFSQTLHWRELPVAEPQGALEVLATDMRFALPGEGRFAARAVVSAEQRIIESQFSFTPPGRPPQPR